MSVISNTTVLANFAAVDALSSLKDLFGEVFLSTDVQPIGCFRPDAGSIQLLSCLSSPAGCNAKPG